MKIPLGGRAIAKEDQGHLLLLAIFHAVGNAHGVRNLRAHRHSNGQIVLPFRNAAALIIAGLENTQARQRCAAIDGRSGFAKRRHHPVGLL